MSVNPGFGGQKFIDSSLEKARKLKDMILNKNSTVFIEMDGGIGLDNMSSVKQSGVDVFVCGNSIFGANDPVKAIKDIKKILS